MQRNWNKMACTATEHRHPLQKQQPMGHTEVKAMELDREKIDDSNLVGLYVITIYFGGLSLLP